MIYVIARAEIAPDKFQEYLEELHKIVPEVRSEDGCIGYEPCADLSGEGSFVTIVEMVFHAFLPSIYEALGVYLPLIVVNCIILGRAEAFANKNTVMDSALDAIGMGIGFTLALSLIALIRESFGSGTITFMAIGSWDGVIKVPFFNKWPVRVMSLAAGALLLMGYLKAFFNWNTARRSAKAEEGQA